MITLNSSSAPSSSGNNLRRFMPLLLVVLAALVVAGFFWFFLWPNIIAPFFARDILPEEVSSPSPETPFVITPIKSEVLLDPHFRELAPVSDPCWTKTPPSCPPLGRENPFVSF